MSFVIQVEDEYIIESLWTLKRGDFYEIDNIPIYINNIALGDIVSAEFDEEDNTLYFEDIIKASGHSVLQIVFFDLSYKESVCNSLISFGCSWEGSHEPNLIGVDLPSYQVFELSVNYLNELVSKNILGYRQACIGF